MYTIKEAAARTGLTETVLRAWERRYGVVEPSRTPGGYRVYDEAALGRLRSMRRLINDGWTASAAAAAVIAGAGPPPGRATEWGTEGRADLLVAEFLDGAAAIDSPRIEAVLDDMFAGGTYERVVDDHVIPALRALGDAWEAGTLSVAGEHLASNAVQRRLAASFQASGPGRDQGRPVLVGMPPGARHELGALMFATALRRSGLPVVYLGADVPLADWREAVDRTNAQAVVVGAVMPADATAAMTLSATLHSARPEVIIAVGGAAAPDPGAPTALADGTIRLPAEVGEAVAVLEAALTTAASTRRGPARSRSASR